MGSLRTPFQVTTGLQKNTSYVEEEPETRQEEINNELEIGGDVN